MKTPGAHYSANGRRASVSSSTSPDSRIFIPSITSQDILDEDSARKGRQRRQQRGAGFMTRKAAVVLLLVVVAVAGAIVAFVVTKGDGTSTKASNESGTSDKKASGNDNAGNSGTSKDTSTNFNSKDMKGSSGGGNAKVYTDPTSEKFSLTAFAIGDWGATTYSKNGSCCARRKGKFNPYDRHAEVGVSKLMSIQAKETKPAVVIGHGDNFYWTGINGPKDQAYRFQLTFEERHGEQNMLDVPFINVMGNHDYGGGSYICMDSNEELVECKSSTELIAALKKKFDLQSTYKSPNNDRWIIKDHYYKYSVEKDGISMDIFNLEMNDADSHGADQICCQCYGYSWGNDTICKGATRGHKMCCGGDTGMYDACMDQFKQWADDSRTQLIKDVKASKATWKIVNSHYNPYGHYGEPGAKKWIDALKEAEDVHVWIAGHTHGEKHDYGTFNVHFIENGAGGGIQSESASGIPPSMKDSVSNIWTAGGLGDDGGNTYGFFSIQASKSWLKVQFHTFDNNWVLTKDDDGLKNGKIGGVAAKHCWYIPSDGSKGKACSS
ncbi:hypothetical protein ATCC90586_003073 [Pythium insidiosum]|nr:hypothetical protein ATCC90586_003073 [Pythium insidiosum]